MGSEVKGKRASSFGFSELALCVGKNQIGIAVRTGTHCTQPLMQRYGIEGTVRASMCFYNTKEEVDRLHEGLLKVKQMFG